MSVQQTADEISEGRSPIITAKHLRSIPKKWTKPEQSIGTSQGVSENQDSVAAKPGRWLVTCDSWVCEQTCRHKFQSSSCSITKVWWASLPFVEDEGHDGGRWEEYGAVLCLGPTVCILGVRASCGKLGTLLGSTLSSTII